MVPRRSALQRGRHGVPVGVSGPRVVPRHLAPQWGLREVPGKTLPHYSPQRVRPGQAAAKQNWGERIAESIASVFGLGLDEMSGSGKIGWFDGLGGLSSGNGGVSCTLLVAPIMDTFSSLGSFMIRLGKSIASNVSSASSRATASG